MARGRIGLTQAMTVGGSASASFVGVSVGGSVNTNVTTDTTLSLTAAVTDWLTGSDFTVGASSITIAAAGYYLVQWTVNPDCTVACRFTTGLGGTFGVGGLDQATVAIPDTNGYFVPCSSVIKTTAASQTVSLYAAVSTGTGHVIVTSFSVSKIG